MPVPSDGVVSEGLELAVLLGVLALGLDDAEELGELDPVSDGVLKLGELDGEPEPVLCDGEALGESEPEPLGLALAVPAEGVRSAGAASQSLGGSVKSM